MIKYKPNDNFLIEFLPLENGKCEYLVNFHDFKNLESKINIRLNYFEFNYYLLNFNEAMTDYLF